MNKTAAPQTADLLASLKASGASNGDRDGYEAAKYQMTAEPLPTLDYADRKVRDAAWAADIELTADLYAEASVVYMDSYRDAYQEAFEAE